MSFSPAILYDILFLIVFSFAAVKSWQKGFLAGLAELIGAVLGVGIAVWGSRALAPEIYQRFFSAWHWACAPARWTAGCWLWCSGSSSASPRAGWTG